MDRKNIKIHFVASFDDASILRKFSILFLISSIIPVIVIFYTYFQNESGTYTISVQDLGNAMIFMVIGVLTAYASMRSLIVKTIQISKENRKALENYLGPQVLSDIDQEQNEIVTLSRSFNAITQQLEENIRNLAIAKRTLQSVMIKVGQGISHMENIDTFLQLIVESMSSAAIGKVGTLMLLNETGTELVVKAVHGTDYNAEKPIRIKLSDGSPFGRLITEKNPQVLAKDFLDKIDNPDLKKILAAPLLCAPMICQGKVGGLLTLSKAEGDQEKFQEDDINFLSSLASQTGIAIENAKVNSNIENTYLETVFALAFAVDAKEKYRRGHIERVTDYAVTIGKSLGLDDEDLTTLKDAAHLHDLGKIGIPDSILQKDAPLTDEEWVVMRRHPEIGESIIKPIRSLQHLCDLIRHHHEKLDGSGYPDRLMGQDISALVRILTVADIFDSLTSERPYRTKKSRHEAFEELRAMKDKIDQDIVEVLVEAINKRPLAS